MAGTKISAATDAVTLNATDRLPIARSGLTTKLYIAASYIATYISSVANTWTAAQFFNSTAIAQKPVVANSSTAYTIDQANGAQFDITLNGVTPVLTLQSVTASRAQILYVTLIQDGTGSRVPSWANVTWASGTAPTVASAIAARTYLSFVSDGTTWTGYVVPASTGSGAVVLAISPTFTGTANFANITTAPTDSHTATAAFATSLTLGTAIQNTTGYDLNVCIGIAVSSATTATIVLGVGSSSTPTTDTIVPSFTTVGSALSINAIVPNNYYLLVNKTGTIASTNNIVVTPL